MSNDPLVFPIPRERLPPPPAGSLEDYVAFVEALAEMRPACPPRDPELDHPSPRFRLVADPAHEKVATP